MEDQRGPIIRDALPGDLNRLANLIHFDSYVHRHLDYRPPLDWVGTPPFPIYEEDNQILATLACPPDPEHIAWIRLFAAAYQTNLSRVWTPLWQNAYHMIRQDPRVQVIAAIPLNNWFSRLLEQVEFTIAHHLQVLSYSRSSLPTVPEQASIHVRPMTLDDLDLVFEIDKQSFPPLWQISRKNIQIAFLQSAIATVAEEDGKLVGYQISTATAVGGHLARLAVKPPDQGKGTGYSLLYDLLAQFKRRGAQMISVNTQEYNHASLNLYKKAGFEPTGEVYPVYQLAIHNHEGASKSNEE